MSGLNERLDLVCCVTGGGVVFICSSICFSNNESFDVLSATTCDRQTLLIDTKTRNKKTVTKYFGNLIKFMIDKNEKLKKSNVSNEIFDLVGISKKNSYSILAGGPRFSKPEG